MPKITDDADLKTEPSWLDAYPPEHRDLLREYGMPPDADRAHGSTSASSGSPATASMMLRFAPRLRHLKDDLFGEGPGDPDEYEPDGDDIGGLRPAQQVGYCCGMP